MSKGTSAKQVASFRIPGYTFKMISLWFFSTDRHDAFCESVQQHMQFFAIRPSALPNAGTPTGAFPLGNVKILPLVNHHGTRYTPKCTVTDKLMPIDDPGPLQWLNHARSYSKCAVSQD